MTSAVPKLQTAEAFGLDPFREHVARNMRDLFRPLDDLLLSGGDPRLKLDPVTRLNGYGCAPAPQPDSWSFASSTASTISERAYARIAHAREELMRAAIAVGLDEALDARIEEMRAELKAQLGLGRDVDVVFAPSGTDAQLQALFMARARLGAALTSIVVGSDQTGSGTAATARGHHFGAITAAGRAVRKDAAIAGLACESMALPLVDPSGEVRLRSDADLAVLGAIEQAAARGGAVLLQIMDSSKFGWRAPSEACLGEIAGRWPEKVQIVVDACQMRLGRGRIRSYLDRGYLVLITGSKYFGGPAFSGALLVPAALSRLISKNAKPAPGLLDYTGRSDWPKAYETLRGGLECRNNLGQWLRWEAALEDMRAYYAVPAAFRARAVSELGAGIEDLIKLTPSLRAIEPFAGAGTSDDEEFSGATIFPFAVNGSSGPLSPEQCKALYSTLMRDVSEVIGASSADREIAARHCLVGQPVTIERTGGPPAAVLRLCIGARLVTDAWSPDAACAYRNLEHQLDCIAGVIAKIELLLAHAGTKCVGRSNGS